MLHMTMNISEYSNSICLDSCVVIIITIIIITIKFLICDTINSRNSADESSELILADLAIIVFVDESKHFLGSFFGSFFLQILTSQSLNHFVGFNPFSFLELGILIPVVQGKDVIGIENNTVLISD